MTLSTAKETAVFIDRDGTLIEETGYLSDVRDLRIYDFAAEALACLKQEQLLTIVVTNQSGIGRGYYGEEALSRINDAIRDALPGLIDDFYFCPHLPDDKCDCRKPRTGMIQAAAREFNIDIPNSWIIGDKRADVETGFNAGLATALVLTGYGESEVRSLDRTPDLVAVNLLEAAKAIVERVRS